ncbi:MAG: hypothetical protein QOC76_5695 [Mycobacterium sp.]|nr:hypothetical protein [Mycobacterium sp.]
MLPYQFSALTLGHAAPDTELDAVVERVGQTVGHDRALAADHRRSPLGGTGHEEFVGIGGAT